MLTMPAGQHTQSLVLDKVLQTDGARVEAHPFSELYDADLAKHAGRQPVTHPPSPLTNAANNHEQHLQDTLPKISGKNIHTVGLIGKPGTCGVVVVFFVSIYLKPVWESYL